MKTYDKNFKLIEDKIKDEEHIEEVVKYNNDDEEKLLSDIVGENLLKK